MDNDFATGYALGSDSNGGNCNNGFGGDAWGGIWGIIILAMVFGWGRGGFGFGGFVDQVDHLLCFAGAFDAHNYSYHNCSTPLDNKRWRWFLLCI